MTKVAGSKKEPGLSNGGLGRIAARSASVALSGQAALFALQVVSVVVMARLLTPTDYGLVGMVVAAIGVGHLLRDVGLSSAAVQATNLSRQQRDNLFWLNSGIGGVLTILAAAIAPLLAVFYKRPEVLEIVWLLAPTFLLAGLATQFRASLVRRLQMGRVAWGEIGGATAGLAAALWSALQGGGYWALVLQQLVGGAVSFLLFALMAGWLPRWYSRQAPMKVLFSFGLPLFGSQIVTYMTNNLDSVVMGRLFGPISVGAYNRAIQVVRIPMNQMRGPLGGLALSVLAKVPDDDQRFMRFVARGQLVMAYPLLLAAGTLAAVAPQVIDVVLGPQWHDVAGFVRLIAIGEGLLTMSAVGAWIYTSRGYGQQLMRFTLFSSAVRIILLFAGSAYGPIGIAVAFAIAPVFLWPISLWWVGRVAQMSTGILIRSSCRYVALVLVASILTWLVAERAAPTFGAPVTLGIAVLTQIAVMAAFSVFGIVREDYRNLFQTVGLALKRS